MKTDDSNLEIMCTYNNYFKSAKGVEALERLLV